MKPSDRILKMCETWKHNKTLDEVGRIEHYPEHCYRCQAQALAEELRKEGL